MAEEPYKGDADNEAELDDIFTVQPHPGARRVVLETWFEAKRVVRACVGHVGHVYSMRVAFLSPRPGSVSSFAAGGGRLKALVLATK